MTVRLRVERNDFAKIAQGLGTDVARALDETTRAVEADAKTRAAFGWLRSSIHRRTKAGRFRREIWADWRWHFVNNGTRSQGAKPFIDPAIEAQRRPFEERLRKLFVR